MSVQAIGQPVRREEDLRLLKGRADMSPMSGSRMKRGVMCFAPRTRMPAYRRSTHDAHGPRLAYLPF